MKQINWDHVDIDLVDEISLPARKRDREPVQPEENPNRRPDGSLLHPEGSSYIGPTIDGYYTGYGQITHPNGAVYIGYFLHGYFHGKGTLKYADGGEYTGQFVNGRRHGKGDLVLKDGQKYNATFSAGKLHGSVTITFPSGLVEERIYLSGVYQAVTRIVSPEGFIISGFVNPITGVGKGTYTHPNGNTYDDEMLKFRPHGYGTVRYGDMTYTGTFQNGKMVLPENSPIKILKFELEHEDKRKAQ